MLDSVSVQVEEGMAVAVSCYECLEGVMSENKLWTTWHLSLKSFIGSQAGDGKRDTGGLFCPDFSERNGKASNSANIRALCLEQE